MSGRGSVARAALLAGIVGAVFQATPFLSALNTCCCAPVVLLGGFAGWMLRSDSGGTAGTGRCGLAGAGAGVLSALIGVPAGAIVSRLAMGEAALEAQVAMGVAQFEEAFRGAGSPPPPGALAAMEGLQRALVGLDFSAWLIVTAILMAAVQSLFGLLGGLLAGGLLRRTPPAAPPAAPGPPGAGPSAGAASIPASAFEEAATQQSHPSDSVMGDAERVEAAPAEDPAVAPGAGVIEAQPRLPPPVPEASAVPVTDGSGRPDVRWDGPVIPLAHEAQLPEASPDRGEIPLEELPLLPAPDEPGIPPPARVAGPDPGAPPPGGDEPDRPR